MQSRWSPSAFNDLELIFEDIRRDKPTAAAKVIKTIYDGCAALQVFPNRGRSGRIGGFRELVFAPLPYIAVYRIKDQVVEIVRIYHGAQDR